MTTADNTVECFMREFLLIPRRRALTGWMFRPLAGGSRTPNPRTVAFTRVAPFMWPSPRFRAVAVPQSRRASAYRRVPACSPTGITTVPRSWTKLVKRSATFRSRKRQPRRPQSDRLQRHRMQRSRFRCARVSIGTVSMVSLEKPSAYQDAAGERNCGAGASTDTSDWIEGSIAPEGKQVDRVRVRAINFSARAKNLL